MNLFNALASSCVPDRLPSYGIMIKRLARSVYGSNLRSKTINIFEEKVITLGVGNKVL
jgi:hypothetical protein